MWRDESNQNVYTAKIATGDLNQISEQNFDETDGLVWTADGRGLLLCARNSHKVGDPAVPRLARRSGGRENSSNDNRFEQLEQCYEFV